MEKRFPTAPELMSWFIYYKLDSTPLGALIPKMINEWIQEFGNTKLVEMHAFLYNTYSDFREEFLPTE